MTQQQANSKRLRLTKVTGFSCVILAFGLLLWARFIIVTGHPRTAVAEPVVQQVTPSVEQRAAVADKHDAARPE